MNNKIFIIIVLAIYLLYESILVPKVRERKISNYIKAIGGVVSSIERCGKWGGIYNVCYKKDKELIHSIVKFKLFSDREWR
jgi:hypothetical protein